MEFICGIVLNRDKKTDQDPAFKICTKSYDHSRHYQGKQHEFLNEDQRSILESKYKKIWSRACPNLPMNTNYKAQEFYNWSDDQKLAFTVYFMTDQNIKLDHDQRLAFIKSIFSNCYDNSDRHIDTFDFIRESTRLILNAEGLTHDIN